MTSSPGNERLISLDAFRGLTIAGMILVNTPGSWSHVFPPLLHASWHGCTPTDLIFPFFLFIVGVSMSFSYARFDYAFSRESIWKLVKRTGLIFLIGLLLNAFPFFGTDWQTLRIMGVLQRIALAFGLGGWLILACNGRKYLGLIAAIILLLYWFLLWNFGDYSLENNFVRSIDLVVFGAPHLYKGFGIPFDPEGLLSSLPAVATVLIGFLTGRYIRSIHTRLKSFLFLPGAGFVLVLAGLLWSLVFPLNKPLWTSSYVLYTSGLAILVLSLFYCLIDILHKKAWASFFVVFGLNPLFIFVLSVVWVKVLIKIIRFETGAGNVVNGYGWLYEHVFSPVAGPMFGSLGFALGHVLFFWLLARWLFQKKIFIRI